MDEREWREGPLKAGDQTELQGTVIARPHFAGAAHLISGDLEAALQTLSPGAHVLGLLEDSANAETHALRIGRDSLLLVSETATALAIGWHPQGFGCSDASDAYVLFELSGPQADRLISEGGLALPCDPSPSAAIRFADITVLLVRKGDAYRLWVPRAMESYIGLFLVTALA